MFDYSQIAKDCRIKVLSMIHKASTSHIASNFSIIDFASVLYENLKAKDEVVWSKGWVAATIYYFLARQGKIPVEDLDKFSQSENGKVKYLGLAETNVPGVLANGGSMGHGLPIACGIALAKKLKEEKGKVYCIMSDGELNEGTTWESCAFASFHKLNNLVIIIDKNDWQAMGRTSEVLDMSPLKDKFSAFGLEVRKVNGHKYKDIENSIKYPSLYREKPIVIIAQTIKGKGVSFMENHLLYHYKNVEKDEYEKAMAELNNNVAIV